MSAHISQLAYKKAFFFSSINQPLLLAVLPQYLWVVRTQASREIEIDITIPGNEPSVGRVLKCPGGKKRKRDCPADNKAGLYFTYLHGAEHILY